MYILVLSQILHSPCRRSAGLWLTPAVRSSPRPSRAALAAPLLPAFQKVNSLAERLKEFQIKFFPKQTYQMSHLTFSFFSMVICTFSWSWLIFFSKSFLAPLRFKSFSRHSALWATTWKKFQNSWYFWKSTANIPPGSAAQLPSWSSHRWVCPSSPQTLSSPCLSISYPNTRYISSSVLIMFQLPNIF